MTREELVARLESLEPMDIVRRGGRYLLVMPYHRLLHDHMKMLFGEYGSEPGFKFFPATHQVEHTSGGKLFGMTEDMIEMRRHRGLRLTASNSRDQDVRSQVRPSDAELIALLKAEG